MKRIGITQRIEFIKDYFETRDSLDHRWNLLLQNLGYIMIPLTNSNIYSSSTIIDNLSLDTIILSGGNSIFKYDKSKNEIALQRDEFEKSLFQQAIKNKIKIFGVCRGMQMINILMGGSISRIKNHVSVRHNINSINQSYNFPLKVNSYHNWGIRIKDLSEKLIPLALDNEENVEAFVNKEKNIMGIMWHPERESPFEKRDKKLLKDFIK